MLTRVLDRASRGCARRCRCRRASARSGARGRGWRRRRAKPAGRIERDAAVPVPSMSRVIVAAAPVVRPSVVELVERRCRALRGRDRRPHAGDAGDHAARDQRRARGGRQPRPRPRAAAPVALSALPPAPSSRSSGAGLTPGLLDLDQLELAVLVERDAAVAVGPNRKPSQPSGLTSSRIASLELAPLLLGHPDAHPRRAARSPR